MTLEASIDVAVEEDVEFLVAVTNAGEEPVELTFDTGLDVDVAVSPSDGDDPVWRWSDDRMFTQAVQTETLEPGESFERTLDWSDPPEGEYEAVATLACDRTVEARMQFEV